MTKLPLGTGCRLVPGPGAPQQGWSLSWDGCDGPAGLQAQAAGNQRGFWSVEEAG